MRASTGRIVWASAGAVVLAAAGVFGLSIASGVPAPAPTSSAAPASVYEPGYAEAPPKLPPATPEPAPAPLVEEPAAPEDPGPVLCPPGSTSNSNDGVNDTSCFPDVCFTITVPDPAYPECDYAFKP